MHKTSRTKSFVLVPLMLDVNIKSVLFSRAASSVPTPTSPAAQAPESDTTPSSPTVNSEAPTATSGSRPVLTPSAALPSYSLSPFVHLLLVLGASVLNYY